MGFLDSSGNRNEILKGNFYLLQLQAIAVGLFSGFISWMMGSFVHESTNTFSESTLVVATAVMTSSFSSILMGLLMACLILLSHWLSIDPDNIATPIAASIGDLVSLVFLAFFASFLSKYLGLFCFILRHPNFTCSVASLHRPATSFSPKGAQISSSKPSSPEWLVTDHSICADFQLWWPRL